MSRGRLLLLLLIGAGGAAAWWFTRAGADGSSRADPGMLAVQWRGWLLSPLTESLKL